MIRGDFGRFALTPRHCGLISAAAAFLFAGILTIGYAPPANALPSFARQTGQPCGTCHTDFAGLTPYGRRFKIGGYTAGGGQYRTTLFPIGRFQHDREEPWVPPIAMMAIIGFTNTQAPLAAADCPYSANNNVVVSPLSFFWGGAITDHIGAFAQVTYNAPPPGGFGTDPFGHTWTWDNTDIRYADRQGSPASTSSTALPPITTPPSRIPGIRRRPGSSPTRCRPWATDSDPRPIIDGAFAAHVVSVGAYAYINDVLYLEASVYTTLRPSAQNDLGTDPFGCAWTVRAPRPIGARPSSHIGATIGSSSEPSAWYARPSVDDAWNVR